MTISVDFDFIHELEGAKATHAYVPDSEGSDSGVTIASGFDLGQRRLNDLKALGLSDDLCERCAPFLGLKKQDAVEKLLEQPLTVTDAEARAIDEAVRRQHLNRLISSFDAASDVAFSELDQAKQTVIASVSFQYGSALGKRAPNFWRQITEGDWGGALANLRAFGDRYPTRRNKEADRLAESIEV
jgi:GH24 family phage-related lysozyme (muramidase)